jgi:hypothetical protein
VEPQHNCVKVYRVYTLQLFFGDEAITPEEAKTWPIRTIGSAEDEADYQVTKDTIEGTRLQAIEHINKY